MADRIFTFLQLFLAGFMLGALFIGLFGNNVPLEVLGGSLAGLAAVVVCRKNWLTKTEYFRRKAE